MIGGGGHASQRLLIRFPVPMLLPGARGQGRWMAGAASLDLPQANPYRGKGRLRRRPVICFGRKGIWRV
jgi:hypothetical protein